MYGGVGRMGGLGACSVGLCVPPTGWCSPALSPAVHENVGLFWGNMPRGKGKRVTVVPEGHTGGEKEHTGGFRGEFTTS